MSKPKNILFIMFDQLRFDYLSCCGHPSLHTPHIDRLAEQGVRFSRCYVQSPVCGSSRMSFYTGRYVHSHGAGWNNFPLKVGEQTLGDHLRQLDMSCWLVGKTHMKVDDDGLNRLGISRDNVIGARIAECGFDIHVRDDGLWGKGPDGFYDTKPSPYNDYLKSKQYPGDNPWHDYANSGISDAGDIVSGFFMNNADRAANIREEDSETPWLTSQAIDFIETRSDTNQPWCCHLSYIKPHWPYIVPAPYHNMYGTSDVVPVNRSETEKTNAHPVYQAFMNNVIGQAFARDDVREKVIPAYMGLIKQCDDQMGRLFNYLEDSNQMDNTVIVITSDHGDYLGDHWLGEKDLFHDSSVRVPMIVFDPSAEADAARGTVCDELVESIDLAATFVEMAGGEVPSHILEGRSLMPFLRGETVEDWREFAISEYDYSMTAMARTLDVKASDARLFMVADKRWKFMHAEGGFRPMLFDLDNDPDELNDLARDSEHDHIIEEMYTKLGKWSRRQSQRTTLSDKDIESRRGKSRRKGILLGVVDGSDVDEELTREISGKAERFTPPDSMDG